MPKRPVVPPKREIPKSPKYPTPADVQERYYGKKELDPKEIEKQYK